MPAISVFDHDTPEQESDHRELYQKIALLKKAIANRTALKETCIAFGKNKKLSEQQEIDLQKKLLKIEKVLTINAQQLKSLKFELLAKKYDNLPDNDNMLEPEPSERRASVRG